ncbi:acid-sensing ion channel 1-like [Antedon mediterranea]|uniref:acid-sensing ion channel 1-like n=1 Tax=Antedon mediterranea TaxID=105859 RepID=UPI003AF67001
MYHQGGIKDSKHFVEDSLFVRRNNEIFYSNCDIPGYVGAAPYSGERHWTNRQWRDDMDIATTEHRGKNLALQSMVNMPIKRRIRDDEEEEVKGRCCGSSFDVFSDETSFHGLKHIKGGNNWSRRISWLIILILALIGLTYQIQRSVSKYFDYPKNTNLDYVTKSSVPFPKVTVCNINMFKFDEVTPLMGGFVYFFIYGLRYLQSLTPDVGITTADDDNWVLDETKYPGDKNLQQFIKYNAHRMEEMLQVCMFNGVECGPSNFTLTYTNYGACYVFNPPTGKTNIKNAGQRRGLSMILNVEHIQYISAPRENVGFRIAIDGQNDIPDLEASGVDVATGMRASIGIRKQTITSLPKPHGTCIESGHRQLKYTNDSYTQSRCYLECETDYFMEACGCRTYYVPGNADQVFCSPANLTGCYLPKYDEFSDHREEYCDCKEACDVENFLKTPSYSRFPSRGVPQTFVVTNQHKYFALGLGFKVKRSMEATRNAISEQLLESVGDMVDETADELNMQGVFEVDQEYVAQFEWQFSIFCYDMIFYLVHILGDNIYYDVTAALSEDDEFNKTHTGVDSDFYQEILEEADKGLRNQIDAIHETMLIATKETPSANLTEEDAELFTDVLLGKLIVIAYPLVWDSCFAFGIHIYTTSDILFLTQEYIADNLARVDIYYETLNVEEVVEQPGYEFFSIVCDLGGALGLFFGASLVAFVEAIDFWLIKGCCAPKKKPMK